MHVLHAFAGFECLGGRPRRTVVSGAAGGVRVSLRGGRLTATAPAIRGAWVAEQRRRRRGLRRRALRFELNAPFAAKTSFDEAFGRGVDVSEGGVADEGFQTAHDLWAFVGSETELCLGEERVEYTKVCVA